MIAVTKDDSIRAFSHRWRKATPTDIKVAPLQRTEITKAIIAQLRCAAGRRSGCLFVLPYSDSSLQSFIQNNRVVSIKNSL
ncbi:MAG: hypothetical protein WA631_00780 [Nitrososphaeraceae archaeon]